MAEVHQRVEPILTRLEGEKLISIRFDNFTLDELRFMVDCFAEGPASDPCSALYDEALREIRARACAGDRDAIEVYEGSTWPKPHEEER